MCPMRVAGTSGRSGPSIRRTSAPQAAIVRVAIGPASTLVRSSTRRPAAPLSVAATRPAPGVVSLCSSGSVATARPCGCSFHSCFAAHRVPQPARCGQGILEILAPPGQQCLPDALVAFVAPEDLQRTLSVPRVLPVHPKPAVGGPPEPRERVEPAGLFHALGARVVLTTGSNRDVLAIDDDPQGWFRSAGRIEH